MNYREWLVGVALTLELLACGTDNETSGAPASCPFPATECPQGCGPMEGMVIDTAKSCKRLTVLGCWSGSVSTDDSPCFKNTETGQLVRASSSYLGQREGWVRCDSDDQVASQVGPCSD